MPTRGNPQLKVRLDNIVLQGLRAYAVAKGILRAELVRQIIMDWVKERRVAVTSTVRFCP